MSELEKLLYLPLNTEGKAFQVKRTKYKLREQGGTTSLLVLDKRLVFSEHITEDSVYLFLRCSFCPSTVAGNICGGEKKNSTLYSEATTHLGTENK